MLEDDSDARTRRMDSSHRRSGLSRNWAPEAPDATQQSRFTATGRTDDAEHFAASYIQFDIAESNDCSFEERVAGVIDDILVPSAIGRRY